jgi:hypothetical protein
MFVDALPITLQHVRHFRSIGCFRLKPAILLALEGDVAGPKGVAWKAATFRFIVFDAGAMAEGNHDHEQHEIPSHVHLLSIGGRFFVGSCTRENIAMQAISDSTATRMNILCDGGESRENVCEQARRQIVVDEDYHLPRRERAGLYGDGVILPGLPPNLGCPLKHRGREE